jgi:hypothetical protein
LTSLDNKLFYLLDLPHGLRMLLKRENIHEVLWPACLKILRND